MLLSSKPILYVLSVAVLNPSDRSEWTCCKSLLSQIGFHSAAARDFVLRLPSWTAMNTKGVIENMKGCDSLDLILKDYRRALDRDSEALSDNAEFMQLKELHFLVKK